MISYLSLFCGILLLVPAIVLDFTGLIGYWIVLLAVFLIIGGVLINKSLREFFFNLFTNFF